ncbi:uncharacterized protein ACR2FA_004017 [Aphomia sociella]
MIFLLETRYLSLDAEQKRNEHSSERNAARAARSTTQPHTINNMSLRAIVVLVAITCIGQAAARPVRRTLNFNMFVLHPKRDAPDRFLLTTDGVSRFGPILEYLVQRVQGLMSVKLPQDPSVIAEAHSESPATPAPVILPIADAAENEVDGIQESKMPGVVVRPSRTKPGTYEVEIDVVVDDGQPEEIKKN